MSASAHQHRVQEQILEYGIATKARSTPLHPVIAMKIEGRPTPSFPRKRESTETRRPAIFILLCGLRKAMVIPAEARDERRLLNFQKRLSRLKLLIIDELGFVPLSKTGAELLFEVFSQRYERGSVLVTTNLPFNEWTEVFGSERLTGALLDRLTHHVHIIEMNGESYRLKERSHTASMLSSD